ncbi:MAG TPA: hypothetical protein VI756_10465 [Blastocatellia bacterium]
MTYRNGAAARPSTPSPQNQRTQQQLIQLPQPNLVRLDELPESGTLERVPDWLDLVSTLRASGKANVLCQMTESRFLPPLTKIFVGAEKLDVIIRGDRVSGDVYQDTSFCVHDKEDDNYSTFALNKKGLSKISALGGADVFQPARLDNRKITNYWHVAIPVQVMQLNGKPRLVYESYELDLRDGAVETLIPEKDKNNRKTGNLIPLAPLALANKRRHGPELAETLALERTIRLHFSLDHTYTGHALSLPFVMPQLVPDVDLSDPVAKAEYMRALFGGASRMWGYTGPSYQDAIDITGAEEIPGDDEGDEPQNNPPGDSRGAGVQTGSLRDYLHKPQAPPPAPPHQQPAAPAAPPAPVQQSPALPRTAPPPAPRPVPRVPLANVNQPPPARKVDPKPAPPAPPDADDFPSLNEFIPPEAICQCGVCGHQAEITKAVAEATKKQLGIATCAACYPGKSYDYNSHKASASMHYPLRPDVTPEDCRYSSDQARIRAEQKAKEGAK